MRKARVVLLIPTGHTCVSSRFTLFYLAHIDSVVERVEVSQPDFNEEKKRYLLRKVNGADVRVTCKLRVFLLCFCGC